MKEIRTFMDDANKQYLARKKIEDERKLKIAKVRAQFLRNKEIFTNCLFDPPNCFKCTSDCQNPLCPKEKDARELLNNAHK